MGAPEVSSSCGQARVEARVQGRVVVVVVVVEGRRLEVGSRQSWWTDDGGSLDAMSTPTVARAPFVYTALRFRRISSVEFSQAKVGSWASLLCTILLRALAVGLHASSCFAAVTKPVSIAGAQPR